MAKPGPKPQPTKVRLLHGNPGKREINPSEPKPRAKAPTMPGDFDDVAKREWKRMAPLLRRLGILTKIDHALFEAYCRTYSEWVHWTKEAYARPLIKAKSGYVQLSPFTTLAHRALTNLRAIAAEFGLTPSSRSRIVAGEDEPDEFDEFIGRNQA